MLRVTRFAVEAMRELTKAGAIVTLAVLAFTVDATAQPATDVTD
jgi:hypothetical protein